MTVPPILILGNANVDLVLGEVDGWPAIGTEVVVERSEMRAGGSAGNAALALSGMGVAHRFIASTGNDPNGAWLREQFDAASCDWIADACGTTVTVGIVHKGGDRAFFTTPGHLQKARLADLLDRLPEAPGGRAFALVSGAFLMPEVEAGTEALLERLRALGWRTTIDPGWPPGGWTAATRERMLGWLGRTDLTLINEEEATALAQRPAPDDAAQALAGRLAPDQILVVKRGAKGASAHTGGISRFAPAPPVAVIDTVGAGDTFNAGFLAALTQGADLDGALRRGVAVAARAISSFPRRYDAV